MMNSDVGLKWKKVSFFLLAVLFPVIFSVIWLMKNTQLPSADSANFLSAALTSYQHFIKNGALSGLLSCYFDRGFRPIIFPVTAVPFMLMSQGNLYIAYCSVALFSLLASLAFVYLTLRFELERLPAAIATNIVGLLPLLQVQILGFYAESLLFPCVLGVIYCLIKSSFLSEKKYAIGFVIFLALAVMLRPIEALMSLFFVFCVFIFYGCKNGIFNAKKITLLVGMIVSALFVFLTAAIAKKIQIKPGTFVDSGMETLLLYLLIFSAIAMIFVWLCIGLQAYFQNRVGKKGATSTLFIPAFFWALLLIIIWFCPFALETFEWIYRTSFGDIAAGTGNAAGGIINPQGSFWYELSYHVHIEGSFVVIEITLLALLDQLILNKNNHLIAKRVTYFSPTSPVIYLLAMTPVSLLEIFFTVQDWPRKLSIAFPALLMVLLIVGLQRARGARIRIAIAAFILLMQFMLVMMVAFSKLPFNPWIDKFIGYYIRPPIATNYDAYRTVQEFLSQHADQYHLKNIGIEVNSNTIEPVDPFLLMTKAQAANVDFSLGYPFFGVFSEKNAVLLTKKFDGLFLSASVNKMVVSDTAAQDFYQAYQNEKNPSIKTMYQFLYYFSKDKLAELGWQKTQCIVIKSACLMGDVTKALRAADCLGCLLVPITQHEYLK